MKIILIAFIILSLSSASAQDAVNDLFDQHRMKPLDLLVQEYQRSKMLFMGFDNHFNRQHLDQLRDLLKVVGRDPKLKYIVLERAHDTSPFYEALSTQEFSQAIGDHPFADPAAERRSLCEPEWSYSINYFLPAIRALNTLRPRLNPVLVKTVDGIISTQDPAALPVGPIHDGTCHSTAVSPSPFISSDNREIQTSRHFSREIWQNLGPEDKAIVLYNTGHLLTSMKHCQVHHLENGDFEARYTHLSWSGYFFDLHPEAKSQTSLVIMDERTFEESVRPTLEFTANQAERFPGQAWATELSPFRGLLKEMGVSMFTIESGMYLRLNQEDTSLTLPEIAQGLIYFPQAYESSAGKVSEHPLTQAYCK